MRASEHKKMLRDFGWRGDALNAAATQQGVIDDETKQLAMGIDYEEAHVRLAAVHTRQDLVLLIAAMNAAAGRLKSIRWMMAIVTLCAVLATMKYMGQ